MLIRRAPDLREADVTDPALYRNRRAFLAGLAAVGVALTLGERRALAQGLAREGMGGPRGDEDPLTPFETVTTYNNFYELGTGKDDPARNAGTLRLAPWKVRVEGEVEKPGDYDLDDLLRPQRAE